MQHFWLSLRNHICLENNLLLRRRSGVATYKEKSSVLVNRKGPGHSYFDLKFVKPRSTSPLFWPLSAHPWLLSSVVFSTFFGCKIEKKYLVSGRIWGMLQVLRKDYEYMYLSASASFPPSGTVILGNWNSKIAISTQNFAYIDYNCHILRYFRINFVILSSFSLSQVLFSYLFGLLVFHYDGEDVVHFALLKIWRNVQRSAWLQLSAFVSFCWKFDAEFLLIFFYNSCSSP